MIYAPLLECLGNPWAVPSASSILPPENSGRQARTGKRRGALSRASGSQQRAPRQTHGWMPRAPVSTQTFDGSGDVGRRALPCGPCCSHLSATSAETAWATRWSTARRSPPVLRSWPSLRFRTQEATRRAFLHRRLRDVALCEAGATPHVSAWQDQAPKFCFGDTRTLPGSHFGPFGAVTYCVGAA